ncbi:unnamed protein product [Ranitomeya imitator]|uniref:CCHC-type domain-containing protein n=1 Tax=Ranitomeya imitator TaxID=111125 RepID=A0ABN9L742_9NEOB|nr:unnamed protein product [Ranitomeya imitator]
MCRSLIARLNVLWTEDPEAFSKEVPPSNAWSRGAPSFTSDANYTGQAFKRRNVVRFRHRGAKEDLPDRRFVVRELLCHQMGFAPVSILAVINLPDRQGYDVSFKLMTDLDRFWSNFPKFRDTEGWSKFSFIPISKPDTVAVNVIFWNESVPPQDIVVWLWRHCDLVSDLTKSRDSDGIWTGGWRVLVKLRQCNNITAHLPNSFFIGRERVVCFYPGQPRKCFICGGKGHLANTCTVVKCSLCEEVGHVAADCQNIRCNLCGKIGHPHRDCPDAWHNICKDLTDEDLVTGAEILEEAALLSGEILTAPEVHQGSTQLTPEQQGSERSMEVVPQEQQSQEGITSVLPSVSEGNSSNKIKRKKKDKTSRKPEKYDTGLGARRKVQSSAGVMVVSNRFDVLSESDGDFEDDLKRIDAECDRDVEDCPPPKRKPLPEGNGKSLKWRQVVGRITPTQICDAVNQIMSVAEEQQPESVAEVLRPESVAEVLRPESVAEVLQHLSVAEEQQPESVAEVLRPESVAEVLRPESVAEVLRPESVAEVLRP